jgi:hypothetical protein
MAEWKQGDTAPGLRITVAVDLADAQSVTLEVVRPDGTQLEWSMTIESSSPEASVITREWGATDNDIAGAWVALARILWADSTIERAPTYGHIRWDVYPNLF